MCDQLPVGGALLRPRGERIGNPVMQSAANAGRREFRGNLS